MSAPEPQPMEQRWPEHERAQLALGRCPWSGLFLMRREVATGRHLFMCGVCDCIGYQPGELGR